MQVHVLLILGDPQMDTVLQSRVEGENHLPQPAGHTSFDAAQDTVNFSLLNFSEIPRWNMLNFHKVFPSGLI